MDTNSNNDNIWLIFPENVTNLKQKYFISLLNRVIEEEISRPVVIWNSYKAAKEQLCELVLPSCILIYTNRDLRSSTQLAELVYTIREKDFYLPLLLVCEKAQLMQIPVPVLTKFDGFIWKDQVNLSPSVQTIKAAIKNFEPVST